MSDLSERLRRPCYVEDCLNLRYEAAAALAAKDAEIERLKTVKDAAVQQYVLEEKECDRLRAENERLRKALQEIALDSANPTNAESHYTAIAKAALKEQSE